VLVAMSGGKDSYALAELLLQHRRATGGAFSLVAVHLDAGQPGHDATPLLDWLRASELNGGSVFVAMVQVGRVGVAVLEGLMMMGMAVRPLHGWDVHVIVMAIIVTVTVLMVRRFVPVPVPVPLRGV